MAAPPSLEENSRFPAWLQFGSKIFFALLASAIVSSLKLDYIESALYDARVLLKSEMGLSDVTDPKIALILINNKTVERYQGFPLYTDHTEFLNKLVMTGPRFVLYDFRTRDGEIRDIEGNFEDKVKFALATTQFKNIFVPSDETEMKGEAGKLRLNAPLESVRLFSGPKSPDTILFAKDGVYRRLMISYQEQKLLHPLIAASYNPEIENSDAIRGKFDFLDSEQTYIHYHTKGSFPTYAFEDVVDGKVPPEAFKDKVVIIGTDTGKSAREYVLTPYSREVNAMTTAELHANTIQTLIDNNSPYRLQNWINIVFTSLISMLTVYIVLALKPSRGLILLGATLAGIAVFAFLLFIGFGWWIDLAHPFLAIFLCYYFFIPYRLIRENRRSWEYYQKNRLLKQVEELKTNFISMMSHDLKTPIARIQGMTEVILKDEQPLTSIQREAVDTIRGSSDDLLRFINSILQYGRIESQGIVLHQYSKDVNQILQEVIKKHEFLAKVKKIKIVQELEPLFPVHMDPDLMKQVFSNLLENAIKYSPDESTVWVSSREESDLLFVDFRDEGIGIPSVDLPNIFMKFFRTHMVKTSTIKGSGLGLYLAQYFVELHKGKIFVQSEPDKGSKFTVQLPLKT